MLSPRTHSITGPVLENMGPRGCATIAILAILAYLALMMGFASDFNWDNLINYFIK